MYSGPPVCVDAIAVRDDCLLHQRVKCSHVQHGEQFGTVREAQVFPVDSCAGQRHSA